MTGSPPSPGEQPPSTVHVAILGDAAHPDLQRWARGLQGTGLRVTLLTFSTTCPEGLETRSLRSRIDMNGLPLAKLGYLGHVPAVRSHLREIGADLAVPYYVGSYAVLALLAGVTPLVPFAVGSDLLSLDHSWWRRLLVGSLLGRIAGLLAISPEIAEVAASLGVPRDRIHCQLIGIDTRPFRRHRCPEPEPGQPLKILSTRSPDFPYNLDLLLRAVAFLDGRGEVRLTVAGDGPALPSLRSLAGELGLGERVRFLGRVTHEEIPRLLGDHNLYTTVVETDGSSASLLEAMVAGLVPVVPDNPANRQWVVDGENGRLLPGLAPEVLARVLLETHEDLELRRRAHTRNLPLVTEGAEARDQAPAFREALVSFSGRVQIRTGGP